MNTAMAAGVRKQLLCRYCPGGTIDLSVSRAGTPVPDNALARAGAFEPPRSHDNEKKTRLGRSLPCLTML
jgi:hypothetical protein